MLRKGWEVSARQHVCLGDPKALCYADILEDFMHLCMGNPEVKLLLWYYHSQNCDKIQNLPS